MPQIQQIIRLVYFNLFGQYAIPLILLICACGCQPGDRGNVDGSTDPQPLHVVATYSILGDWVQQVGGDRIQLSVLVGPGGDAHTYEPTPQDVVTLSQASIVFENGLEFETWLDKLFTASQSKARRCVVTTGIEPRSIPADEVSGDGHVHEVDPHVWHSPSHAISMVNAIAKALAEADPQHADQYRQRADAYLKELEQLELEIKQHVNTIPEHLRKLVTTHDTFGYFADDYGFEVLSVLGSASSEASDPSAAEVAAVIARVQELKIPAVFAENILNPRLTQQVAREAGVKLVATLYTDALGEPGSPGETYLDMMRFNIKTIAESLRVEAD